MADIYANSYLNIAALNAASDSVGCFTSRPARKYVPLNYTTSDNTTYELKAFLLPTTTVTCEKDYLLLEDELLSRRGWALQERCLAPRTLHFGAHQMYFECYAEFRSEDGACCVEGRHNNSFRLQPSHEAGEQRVRHQVYPRGSSQWYNLVSDFSKRDLTYITDRLPALSGLAKVFERQLQDRYIAGLWGNTMVEDLCWKPAPLEGSSKGSSARISPPQPYCGPSWSWVSMKTACSQVVRAVWGIHVATVVEARVDLAGGNPYGEILKACLDIRAPLVPLVDSETWLNGAPALGSIIDVSLVPSDGAGSGMPIWTMLDEKMDNVWLQGLELFALVLSYYQGGMPDESLYIALLVTPVLGQEKKEYRRLGIFDMLKKAIGERDWMKGETELPVVTLV